MQDKKVCQSMGKQMGTSEPGGAICAAWGMRFHPIRCKKEKPDALSGMRRGFRMCPRYFRCSSSINFGLLLVSM